MRYLVIAMMLSTLPLHAEDASAILAKVDQYRSPLESFVMDVQLTSHRGSSLETSRFRVYGKGSDRSLVEFTAPGSEKGKQLLMLRDAMWIYLPNASRPVRISPLQRLMGQASNGDVARTSFNVDYTVSGSIPEEWEGRPHHVLDLVAKDPSVSYAKIRLWVDRSTYEPRRADFYVASGKLVKRARYTGFDVMAGRRMVTRVEIEDLLRKGEKTVMTYSALTARDNPEKMFSRDSLGRW